MTEWQCHQLTHGSGDGSFHSHAYYDIPVLDASGRFLIGHRVGFQGRHPTPNDPLEIGMIDLDGDRQWRPLGSSHAWSWQQGAMSQWLPGPSLRAVWNDRAGDGDTFVARLFDVETGATDTIPIPLYALSPAGRFALSLNMARLQTVRPGYGYAVHGGGIESRAPHDDGVWRYDFHSGERRLVLSLHDAKRFLLSRLSLRQRAKHAVSRYIYWFNHAKISPDGRRFTVKLRFRSPDLSKSWNDQMGVSLTANVDGGDLRLLARGASHVIWLSGDSACLWQPGGVSIYKDSAPEGKAIEIIAPELTRDNVHIQPVPGTQGHYVFDTPYREDIDLILFDSRQGTRRKIAQFTGHQPKKGPFRCDLHPYPAADGQRIIVTSLADGGRQMYLLERKD
jgi:hypothetical protein|tara:strand:- start:49071 stop:50249 length:1179 start_codon:yes stop_codon:yes gene_type:complete